MATLTQEQLDFLHKQNIHIDDVFDATGMTRSEYQILMKEKSKIIAFGVTPCKDFGHTLRTSAGHCAQCSTATIAFTKRHLNKGYVYIAGSRALRVIKVGITFSPGERAKTLNKTKYGNSNDWQLLCECECKEAGMIEREINNQLKIYSVSGSYFHDNHTQEAFELFSCSYDKVFQSLKEIKLKFPDSFMSLREKKDKIVNYNFPNLRVVR